MSQTINTLIQLREMILNGKLPPGERLLEVALVEQLEVSRTPIRAALVTLAQEGLLEQLPGGGYMVRSFTEMDIKDAIEGRGMVEGMAARIAAERGASSIGLNNLKSCVADIDDVLDNLHLDHEGIGRYLDLNELFHRQLIVLAESFVVERLWENVITLPFASHNAFVIANSEIDQSWKVFFVAQEQHRGLIEAIESREGTRAEALAREHAYLSLHTLRTALKNPTALNSVPGIKLVSNFTP